MMNMAWNLRFERGRVTDFFQERKTILMLVEMGEKMIHPRF